MTDGELEKLIRKAADGDEEAFGCLYDEFVDALYKFIRFKVTDPDQAEDLLQDVFIKAWHGIPKLDLTDLHFSAWLYTVAGNTVNDYFRRMYRRPQTVTLNPDIEITSAHDTGRAAEASMNTGHVRAALDKLPPRLQTGIGTPLYSGVYGGRNSSRNGQEQCEYESSPVQSTQEIRNYL